MLSFDPERHEYRWKGDPVPSVTRIIASWCDFSHIPPATLERARQQGAAIHHMVEEHCKGLAHQYIWPLWMRGHIDAWQRFIEDVGFECWAAERRVYHPTLHYAGTADLFGELTRLKVKGPACIDVKRSFYGGPIIGLQTSGYAEAWNEEAPKDMRIPAANRFALRLDEDGKYRLQRYESHDDWNDFVAALRQFRFRERYYGGQHVGSARETSAA